MLSYKSNEEIMKELGTRLKDIRIGYNYTQQELAKRACVSLSTVSRIEKGENVSVNQLLSIFRELHLIDKLNDFIPRQEPTTKENCTSCGCTGMRSRTRSVTDQPMADLLRHHNIPFK